ncbi:MAG: ABC transporter permease [Bacteroidales bacterium]
MTNTRAVLEVARWEFHRFFKLRQQLISLAVTFVVGAATYAVVAWVRGSAVATVAVSAAPAGFVLPSAVGVRVVDGGARSRADLRRDVESRDVDGALIFTGPDDVSLIVRGTPGWVGPLEAAVNVARRHERIRAADLPPATVEAMFAPVAFRIEEVGGGRAAARANRISAILVGSLMLIGIWVGQAYMFVGITGEKQGRVTEQVVSAIPAQAWMDGKILGLSAVAAASTAGYVLSGLILVVGARLAGFPAPLPAAFGTPGAVTMMVLLAVAGFAFWNTFIAAIAAIINDPNSSNRGGFIMLPMVPVAIAMMATGRPDALPIRVLSMLPPTASPIMLTRIVVGTVAWWETSVALALLVVTVWGMRLLAGRIFRTSLLMYGKEPTWSEVWRWLRAA